MRVTKKQRQNIVKLIADRFPSFGGGRGFADNPTTMWLKDAHAQFALGVPVGEVVDKVIYLLQVIEKQQKPAKRGPGKRENEPN